MGKLQAIQSHRVYQEILKDSFGGVMYNVANQNKYDTINLLSLRNNLSANEKQAAGGIMQGAMNFIQGK